jgi:hypothetical protein
MAVVPPQQDLPPKGGFPAISYIRNLPKRGFSSGMLLAGLIGFTAWGGYKYIKATSVIMYFPEFN